MKAVIGIGLGKEEYNAKIKEIKDAVIATLEEQEKDEAFISEAKGLLSQIEKDELRNMILTQKRRIDGRSPVDIRDIWTQVGYIPRTHGSSIFTRGETQALVSVTLGTKRDEQNVDTLFDQEAKKVYASLQFPTLLGGRSWFYARPWTTRNWTWTPSRTST